MDAALGAPEKDRFPSIVDQGAFWTNFGRSSFLRHPGRRILAVRRF
jgi:hypothetical protein